MCRCGADTPATPARPAIRRARGTTEGLAPKIVDELFELIASLARDGTPIVLIEQNVRRAVQLATRFYLIERGSVTLRGQGANARDRAALLERIAV